MTRLDELGEFGLIDRLRDICGPPDSEVVSLGIGDDAALLDVDGTRLVWTVDALVEQVHFRWSWGPKVVGHLVAVHGLSDLAAMGARPVACLVSASFPPDTDLIRVEELYRGLSSLANGLNCPIVGGNLTRTPGPTSVHLTALGQVERRALTRQGSRVGDGIYVSGTLGGPAWALDRSDEEREEILMARRPRIAIGRCLAASDGVRAAIDCSDGLLADLGHLLEGEAIGATLDEEALPAEPALPPSERTVTALTGGEEFELIWTGPRDVLDPLADRIADETGIAVTLVGHIETEPGIRLRRSSGGVESMSDGGWDHFSS